MNFGIDYVLVYLMYSKYVLLSNVFFILPSLLYYMYNVYMLYTLQPLELGQEA